MSPYERLANAIVLRAVDDYRDALKRLAGFPHDRDSNRTKAEIERFFHSGWFSVLTSLDGVVLMEKLRKELNE